MSPGKAQAFKALFFVLRAAASVMLLAPEFTSPLNSPRPPPKKGNGRGNKEEPGAGYLTGWCEFHSLRAPPGQQSGRYEAEPLTVEVRRGGGGAEIRTTIGRAPNEHPRSPPGRVRQPRTNREGLSASP